MTKKLMLFVNTQVQNKNLYTATFKNRHLDLDQVPRGKRVEQEGPFFSICQVLMKVLQPIKKVSKLDH